MVDRLTGKKAVGIKQTAKAIKSGEAKIVYIAKDADGKLVQNIEMSARENALEIKYINTMKELGRLCGIDVGAATAAILQK